MLEYMICPSCGSPKIGLYYFTYLAMKEKYIKDNMDKLNKFDKQDNSLESDLIINNTMTSNFSANEILNELKIENVCCRDRMITTAIF